MTAPITAGLGLFVIADDELAAVAEWTIEHMGSSRRRPGSLWERLADFDQSYDLRHYRIHAGDPVTKEMEIECL